MGDKLLDDDDEDGSDSESTKSDERVISNRIKPDDLSDGGINKTVSVGYDFQKSREKQSEMTEEELRANLKQRKRRFYCECVLHSMIILYGIALCVFVCLPLETWESDDPRSGGIFDLWNSVFKSFNKHYLPGSQDN